MRTLGHTRWAIPEGQIPGASTGPEPAMTSHETATRQAELGLITTIAFASD